MVGVDARRRPQIASGPTVEGPGQVGEEGVGLGEGLSHPHAGCNEHLTPPWPPFVLDEPET